MRSKRVVFYFTACLSTLPTHLTAAERAETVKPAFVFERDQCIFTPDSELQPERDRTAEFFGPVIAAIVAGLAGDLIKSGINAGGDALDVASQEHGFVAEGVTDIKFGAIDPGDDHGKQATFSMTEHCLSLYMPSGEGRIQDMFTDPTLIAKDIKFDWLKNPQAQTALANDLKNLGMTSMPSIYAEGVMMPGKEGFIFRPTFLWYRTVLKGAPRARTAAEMHVLFATPGFDASKPSIGTGFAGARLTLPKIAPGDVLDAKDLRGSRSVWLPLRPTAGSIDSTLQSINATHALVTTRTAELAKAERTLAAAKRAKARKPGPEADEAVQVAQEGRDESKAALDTVTDAGGMEHRPAGATNVQLRVVVVRDEDKFGKAIASALKGQAETAGKAVTDTLTPKPDWAATDTGLITAMIAVEQKQKLYDDAIAAGDAAAMVATGQDLRIAKAKANEAAVAAKKPLPFAGIQ